MNKFEFSYSQIALIALSFLMQGCANKSNIGLIDRNEICRKIIYSAEMYYSENAGAQLAYDLNRFKETDLQFKHLERPPRLLWAPPPSYPRWAKICNVEGSVVLRARINETGKVVQISVIGNPSSSLAKAAVDAVSQWQFQPNVVSGKPASVTFNVPMNFEFYQNENESKREGLPAPQKATVDENIDTTKIGAVRAALIEANLGPGIRYVHDKTYEKQLVNYSDAFVKQVASITNEKNAFTPENRVIAIIGYKGQVEKIINVDALDRNKINENEAIIRKAAVLGGFSRPPGNEIHSLAIELPNVQSIPISILFEINK
ncbi:MAG: energy transducer TonB [Xylophilus ampelinus]